MRQAIELNLAVLDEGRAVLAQLREAARDETIARVGPHFRHCIDFYDCFLAGLPSGRVDYDARARAARIEASPRTAASELERIRQALQALTSADLDRDLDIVADTMPAHAPTRSTVRRELAFLLSHTIHHYALIAMLLRQDGVKAPAEFGFAPSTLAHAAHED